MHLQSSWLLGLETGISLLSNQLQHRTSHAAAEWIHAQHMRFG
jgi:hypothetical protein